MRLTASNREARIPVDQVGQSISICCPRSTSVRAFVLDVFAESKDAGAVPEYLGSLCCDDRAELDRRAGNGALALGRAWSPAARGYIVRLRAVSTPAPGPEEVDLEAEPGCPLGRSGVEGFRHFCYTSAAVESYADLVVGLDQAFPGALIEFSAFLRADIAAGAYTILLYDRKDSDPAIGVGDLPDYPPIPIAVGGRVELPLGGAPAFRFLRGVRAVLSTSYNFQAPPAGQWCLFAGEIRP